MIGRITGIHKHADMRRAYNLSKTNVQTRYWDSSNNSTIAELGNGIVAQRPAVTYGVSVHHERMRFGWRNAPSIHICSAKSRCAEERTANYVLEGHLLDVITSGPGSCMLFPECSWTARMLNAVKGSICSSGVGLFSGRWFVECDGRLHWLQYVGSQCKCRSVLWGEMKPPTREPVWCVLASAMKLQFLFLYCWCMCGRQMDARQSARRSMGMCACE